MPARKKPTVRQEDIEKAIDDLRGMIDDAQLPEVDKYFAMDLLQDYGKCCGIAEAAWRSIVEEGLTVRQTSGGKGNNHYRMTKSESISIFKDARTAKTDLAMKISKLVKSGMTNQEEEDELDAFLRS